jgi:hypothetical protein
MIVGLKELIILYEDLKYSLVLFEKIGENIL